MIILVNFAHPLTEEQRRQLVEIGHDSDIREVRVSSQIDQEKPLLPQVQEMLRQAAAGARDHLYDYDGENWRIIFNFPSLSASAVVMAALLAKADNWPDMLRLKPVPGALPPRFEVAEIISLRDVAYGYVGVMPKCTVAEGHRWDDETGTVCMYCGYVRG